MTYENTEEINKRLDKIGVFVCRDCGILCLTPVEQSKDKWVCIHCTGEENASLEKNS